LPAFISLDFLRSAVPFLMTPTLAALSITETAALRAESRSSGGAVLTRLTAVAMRDLMDLFLALSFSSCLRLLIADFLCGNATSIVRLAPEPSWFSSRKPELWNIPLPCSIVKAPEREPHTLTEHAARG